MNRFITKSWFALSILCILIITVVGTLFVRNYNLQNYPNGKDILRDINAQLMLGDRYVGAVGHEKLIEFITSHLESNQAGVEKQSWYDEGGQELTNIISRINPALHRRVIVASHYDTKKEANRDNINPNLPVPGANDGASGTAIILQLAKDLSMDDYIKNTGVDLVFFDGEEFEPGPFDNWQPKGSSYFVHNIKTLYPNKYPELAIVPDMVCKQNLQLYKEKGTTQSAPQITEKLWEIGKSVDSSVFIDKTVDEVKDDHTLLASIGVPSVLLIDLNYPSFHTTSDTIDKCSPKSLESVYQTIKKFLIEYDRNKID